MDLSAAPFYDDVAEGPDNGAAYWITTADGVRIRVGVWPLHGAKGTVLLFPGRTEYIEKYGRGAADLAARGYATVSIDWRGQGLADRLIQDPASGFVDKFTDYQIDIAAMLGVADALNMPGPRMLLAHSMGGCIGLRALMDGLPVNAAVFSAPMWGITMSNAMRPAAWAMSWASRKVGLGGTLAPGTTPQTYVLAEGFEGNNLTTDPDMYRYMQDQVGRTAESGMGHHGVVQGGIAEDIARAHARFLHFHQGPGRAHGHIDPYRLARRC